MGDKIVQVIGCAHNYKVSKAARHKLSKERSDHSSHRSNPFSYFKKVENPEHIVHNDENLILRRNPETNEDIDHWYEPELAIVLGEKHRICAYTLANDLSATGIEFKEIGVYDPTYLGKCWKGSCSLGPRFVDPELVDADNLEINLMIERNGQIIYGHGYNTASRCWPFSQLPDMIVDYYLKLKNDGKLRQSKQILVHHEFLPEGTVILTGTGLIVPRRCFAMEGDIATVECPPIGKLINPVKDE